jgi:hypothetical protein
MIGSGTILKTSARGSLALIDELEDGDTLFDPVEGREIVVARVSMSTQRRGRGNLWKICAESILGSHPIDDCLLDGDLPVHLPRKAKDAHFDSVKLVRDLGFRYVPFVNFYTIEFARDVTICCNGLAVSVTQGMRVRRQFTL